MAQRDRVLVVGFAKGKIKATNKTFVDDWIFAITVRDGRLTNIRGIRRHPSTGPGLADGRVWTCVAQCSRRLGVDGGSAVDCPSHAASSSFAQP